jgi:hypothetical protein
LFFGAKNVPLNLDFFCGKVWEGEAERDPPAARKVTTRQRQLQQQIPFGDDSKKDKDKDRDRDKDKDKDKGRQRLQQEQEDVLLQQWIPFGMTTRKVRVIRIFRGCGAKRFRMAGVEREAYGVISEGVFEDWGDGAGGADAAFGGC